MRKHFLVTIIPYNKTLTQVFQYRDLILNLLSWKYVDLNKYPVKANFDFVEIYLNIVKRLW